MSGKGAGVMHRLAKHRFNSACHYLRMAAVSRWRRSKGAIDSLNGRRCMPIFGHSACMAILYPLRLTISNGMYAAGRLTLLYCMQGSYVAMDSCRAW